MIGQMLSRYRLVERIGVGGMGEVYRAEDTVLQREVAVKVLRADVAQEAVARGRFNREVRAIASLSHANILAIHDYGVENDFIFAVMELLEGCTLREEADGQPMPPSVALDRALQVAKGLATAHRRSLVHRDLKPENIFVTPDGTVKVLDFGLAKFVEASSLAVTQTGTLVGTAPYMAPEQLQGSSLDARCDVFAFGVILYELLSGENPFRRDSIAATATAILHHEPPALASSGLPNGLSTLVQECLAKEPNLRPADAGTLVPRLDALTSGSSTTAPSRSRSVDSVAVLPFVNESEDPDADFLSDGITDALIETLSQLPRLKVMARSTVYHHRDLAAAPMELAAELGVNAVVTGRLRRRSDTIVIRAELVNGGDGSQLWSSRFKRQTQDLLDIEEEIAHEIADNLRLQLSSEERSLLAKRSTEDPRAYQAYLRGRHVWNQWKTPDGMRTAIGFFERALEFDPLFARAFAGLADSYNMLGNVKALPPQEAYPRARTMAEQGLAIDEGLAELHTSLGFTHRHWDWDWSAAERSYRRAIELNPDYATAHRWLGHLLAGLGQHEESIAASRRAVELEPLSLLIRGALGDSLFYARRYEEAIAFYRETLDMDSNFLAGRTDLARALELAGQYEDAIDQFQAAAALAPKGPPEPSSGLAHVYAQMGRRNEALAIVDQLKQLAKEKYVSPYGIASIYACLEDVSESLDWLEKAYDEHDQTLVWVKVHPRLDPIRDDARYTALLEKMNLAP